MSTTIIPASPEILAKSKLPFLLGLHNNLCKSLQQDGLKSWSKSKDELIKRILRLQEKVEVKAQNMKSIAVADGAYGKKRNSPKAKKTAKAKSTGAGRPRDEELAKAIAKAGITSKQARARFRRAGLKGPYTLNAQTKKALAD